MPEYKYPATDYDRANNLLNMLGTFWSELYQGRDQVSDMLLAKGQVENQTIVDVLEVADSLSRYTVPVFHVDNWYALRLLESERNTGLVNVSKFGDDNIFYDSSLRFGIPPTRDTHSFPAPENLSDVSQIYNRFTSPSLCWSNGADFLLDGGVITFKENPFEDARVAKRLVYSEGEVVDEEAVLWLFRGDFDYDTLYRQYGYVLSMRFGSSRNYRKLLNAFFDAIVGGTTAQQLLMAASAITGIPLVAETEETVEQLSIDNNGRLVITDQNVYRFPEEVTPVVEEGDVVHFGESLADSLEVIELNQGEVPDTLTALAMGKGFLATCYYGDLIFENKEVPLEVDEDHSSGFTYVSFGLGGFPLDVQRFFDDMHERGIAESQKPVDDCDPGDTVLVPGDECDGEGVPDQIIRRGTLAHLLDVRPNPIGEPTAASLPANINPLHFLVQNVLRCNAVIIKVRTAGLGASHLGLHASAYFRRIVPPHTAVILLIELTTPADSISEDEFEEDMSTFTALEILADDVTEGMFAESMGIKLVSGTCH